MKYHLVLGLCLELVEGEVRPRGGLGRGKAMLPKIAAHLQTLNGLSPQAYACVEKAENLRACFTAPRVEGSRLRFLLVAGGEQEGQKMASVFYRPSLSPTRKVGPHCGLFSILAF